MKLNLLKAACLSVACFVSAQVVGQTVTTPPGGGNQRSIVTQYIGSLVTVSIDYNSPDVHAPNGDDRRGQIWGQLVPYGMTNLGFGPATESPWRAGANQNTVFTVSHDVQVQGKDLKAGAYGLHVIVEETGPWTIIFSNNSTAWGSFFYDPTQDALRVEATPEDGDYTEWLTYEFVDRQPEQTTVALKWEEKMLPFTISIPNATDMYVANMRNELQNVAGFNWQGWAAAANYCATNNVNLEEALTWADNGISAPFIGQQNWATLSAKAAVLNALERTDEAIAVMDMAVNDPTATPFAVHAYGRRLITQGQKEKALEIFKLNQKNNDGAWPTNYGLARGYSAVGDFKNALKYLKMAKDNVPANDTVNPPIIEANIKKLENKEDIN
ncbi:MAG: DUF2911 domain-containing protein [Cyclobacteriaceae bacterium]